VKSSCVVCCSVTGSIFSGVGSCLVRLGRTEFLPPVKIRVLEKIILPKIGSIHTFNSLLILDFDLSSDGKELVMTRGTANRDVVLIRDVK